MESQQERPWPKSTAQEESRRTFTSISHITRRLFAKDTQVPVHEPAVSSNTSTQASTSVFSTQTSKTADTTVSIDHGSKVQPMHGLQAVHESDVSTVQVTKALHMLPTMPIPEPHLNTWHVDIQQRLNDEFSTALNTAWGHFEFKMVRDRKGRVGPCIIFIGWDEASCTTPQGCEKARRKLKRLLGDLQSLRRCPFPVEVVMDRTSLLGPTVAEHLKRQSSTMIGSSIEGRIKKHQSSLVGVQIRRADNIEQICTLGGMALAFGNRLALTVSHPFSSSGLQKDSIDTEAGLFDDHAEQDDDDCSDCQNEDSDSLFDEYEAVLLDALPSVLQSTEDEVAVSAYRTTTPSSVLEDPLQATFRDLGQIRYCSREYEDASGTTFNYDWALIELASDVESLPNALAAGPDNHELEIVWAIHFNFALGDRVVLLTGFSGYREGRLGQRHLQITLRGIQYEVTQILLSTPLAFGDSGSWVVHDSKPVGCIIAGLESLPYAYMVPMASVLEDIRRSVGGLETNPSLYSSAESLGPDILEGFSAKGELWESRPQTKYGRKKVPLNLSDDSSLLSGSTAVDTLDYGVDPPFAAVQRHRGDTVPETLEMNTYAKTVPGTNSMLDEIEPVLSQSKLRYWRGTGSIYEEDADLAKARRKSAGRHAQDPPAPSKSVYHTTSLPPALLRPKRPSRLGAIDENGGMSPDIPVKFPKRPVRRIRNSAFQPSFYPPPYTENNDNTETTGEPYTEHNDDARTSGERLADLRRNHRRLRRGGFRRLGAGIALVMVIIVGLTVGLSLGLRHR